MPQKPAMQHGQKSDARSSDGEQCPPLRIQLLGGFRVTVGDRVVPDAAWRSQKARNLVKILCLASRHQMHREEVIDLLWSEIEPDAAANNFRYTLHAARHALNPDGDSVSTLVLDGSMISLQPGGPLWIDAEAFESTAAVAQKGDDPEAYTRALDLYTGDLLPEDRYEDWAVIARDNLRELYLSLLMDLGQIYKESRKREAIETFRRVVDVEPAHEDAHVELMHLYALTGQRRRALRQYQKLRDTLRDEIDVAPEPASQQLYAMILAGQFADGARSFGMDEQQLSETPEHNLPVPLSSFIGREREISRVKESLGTTRLLTLTGTGGCGKTRLALEVAREVFDDYPDGLWYVELASVTAGNLVPQVVTSTIGLPEQTGRTPVETLVGCLQSRQVLLLLDNCEHLIDACSQLAVELLRACPHLKILTTSREVLRVPGELALRVPSLAMPDTTSEQATESEAVRLFGDRARFIQPGFELTPDNVGPVLTICRQVDGLPLAIELAAARVPVLAIDQLAQRLENALQILTGGSRTAVERHQTLRATLAWSYNLLDEAEKYLFERLAVFAGGWTLEAAETVTVGAPVDQSAVLDLLSHLVDKSLIVTQIGSGGNARYSFLEPVRQYARERLVERGESDKISRRHAALYLAHATQADSGLKGARQGAWLEYLEADHDNVRTALTWAFEYDPELAARLASAMWRFWYMHGHLSEGREWISKALALAESLPPLVRAKTLQAAASLAWCQGDLEASPPLTKQALDLYRRVGDSQGIRDMLGLMGTIHSNQGEYDRARRYHEESLALERQEGHTWGISRSLGSLAELAFYEGDNENAQAYWEESLVLDRLLEDTRSVAITTNNLGEVLRSRGDLERARDRFTESLALFKALDFKHGVAAALSNLAEIHLLLGNNENAPDMLMESINVSRELGHPVVTTHFLEVTGEFAITKDMTEHGVRLFGASDALRESAGIPLSPSEQDNLKPWFESARARLTNPGWEEAWSAGRSLSVEQAIEQAIKMIGRQPVEQGDTTSDETAISILTRREREIVPFLAAGLTNGQIAAELGMSNRTADTHVSNILRKLGLSSRSEIREWAIERQIIPPDEPLTS